MTQYALPALFALFVWWFSTGAILYLDGLPQRTFGWRWRPRRRFCGFGVYGSSPRRRDTPCRGPISPSPAPCSSGAGTRSAFLMGFVTGPAGRACGHGCRAGAMSATRCQAILWHELAILASGAVIAWLDLGRRQPDRRLDLRDPLGDAAERQAQRLPRRAEPHRDFLPDTCATSSASSRGGR